MHLGMLRMNEKAGPTLLHLDFETQGLGIGG